MKSSHLLAVVLLLLPFAALSGCACEPSPDESIDDSPVTDDSVDIADDTGQEATDDTDGDDSTDDEYDDSADDATDDTTFDDDAADDTSDDSTDDTSSGDDDNDDTMDDSTDDDEFYNEDFESYTIPDLSDSWDWGSYGAQNTIEVTAVRGGSGQVLHINDADAFSDYSYAFWKFPDLSDLEEAFTVTFDYKGSSGQLSFDLYQYNTDTQFYHPEAIIDLFSDGNTELSVYDIWNYEEIPCGIILNPDTWYEIELTVDPTLNSGNFSISVDGTATSCSSYPFYYSDYALRGYKMIGYQCYLCGGEGYFDNIVFSH